MTESYWSPKCPPPPPTPAADTCPADPLTTPTPASPWIRRNNAARELLEELGVGTDPDDLMLWAVTRGDHGDVGIHFAAPP